MRQEFQGKPTKKRNVATHCVNGLTETNDYAVCHSLFITLVMGKRHSSVISNLPVQRAIFHLSVIIVMLWHYSSSYCSLQKFLWCLFSKAGGRVFMPKSEDRQVFLVKITKFNNPTVVQKKVVVYKACMLDFYPD